MDTIVIFPAGQYVAICTKDAQLGLSRGGTFPCF